MALATPVTVIDMLARSGPHNDTLLDSQAAETESGIMAHQPPSDVFENDTQLPEDFESSLLAQPWDDDMVHEGESHKEEVPPAEAIDDVSGICSQVKPAEAIDDLFGMCAQAKPVCNKCLTEVEPFRAQIKGKTSAPSAMRWLCNSCNSKLASLSRSFGKWPIPEFLELTEEQQKSFWKDTCLPGVNLHKMKSMLLAQVVKSRADQVEATIQGSWLPIGVYASQGYDTALIEKNCTGDNVRECPLLGKTYRVPVTSLSRSTTESRVRETILKSWADVSHSARSVAAASATPTPATSADAEPVSDADNKVEPCIANVCESNSIKLTMIASFLCYTACV